MTARLTEHLKTARRSLFVGRSHELALFQAALTSTSLPFHVLYIIGAGGVGKTTLLNEFAALCAQFQVAVFRIDARNVEPVPETFTGTLQQVMEIAPGTSPFDVFASAPQRQVLLIDTFEILAPIEGWMRDSFLPQLPEHVLVVFGSRQPPSLQWRTDPGWQPLMHLLPLDNLSLAESRTYLMNRSVPADQQQAVLDFTHGHPLALSLVADVFAQRRNVQFQPEAAPDMIKTLLEQFVQKVPSPAHRAALEACALVRLMTETLLAEMLTMPDAHELFTWLRDLSFIEANRQGLFPHDLAREALDADLRWRNPDWYNELHRRARLYYATRLQQTNIHAQQRILADYIFLHRNNPVVRPFFEWQSGGSLFTDTFQPGDEPALLAMVAAHEGAAAVDLARHWFARQPAGMVVIRDPDRQPIGLLMQLALDQVDQTDRQLDPAVHASWQCLQQRAPLRPGETATLFRFWMARDGYQAVSPVQSLIFINVVRHYLATPGLAFTFFPCADPDFWAPMLTYADLIRLPEADFALDNRRYGMYGHDWRVVPPIAWLDLLAEREIATEREVSPPTQPPAPLAVLSEEEFAASVRSALQDYVRPDVLQTNPLVQSLLVTQRAGASASVAERVSTLQTQLKAACDALQASPRDRKAYRALYHTYLQPAPSQEQAAELLNLPFSTFRRHLKTGITRVTDMLWQWELQG